MPTPAEEIDVSGNGLFKKEVIKGRYADLFAAATVQCKIYNERRSRLIGVDRAALLQATWCAYDDIARYKAYHLDNPKSKRSNAVKRAAYVTKWVLRSKPLVALDSETRSIVEQADETILLNAMFALKVSLNYIQLDVQRRFQLSDETWYNLLYDFIFRDLDADGLIAIYQMVLDSAQGRLFRVCPVEKCHLPSL